VLRPGRVDEESAYQADDDPDTVHVAARVTAGPCAEVVSVGTVLREAPPWEPERADGWRVRGMATRPDVRRQGLGGRVLDALLDHVAGRGGGLVWCNARVAAEPLYTRAGFMRRGGVFELPGIGPHHLMWRTVGARRWSPPLVVTAVMVGALGFGLFARLWLLSNTALNSDEAVVGLMAKQALHGHLSTFYWGQQYGGLESLPLAGLFGVFGAHAWLVRAAAGLFSAAACVVVWRLGRRIFGTGVGVTAAVVAWVWPESDIRNSVQAFGFRGVVLLCGLFVILAATRIDTDEDRRSTWALLGAAIGVGWWASPEILYFVVPAAPFVALSVWRRRRRGPSATPGNVAVLAIFALAGMAPWLYTNAHTHFASLRAGAHYGPMDGTAIHRVGILFTKTLPIILGTRTMQSGTWLGGAVGVVLYVVLLGLVVLSLLVLAQRAPRARILIALLVAFPWLYSAAPTGYWEDGRFAVYFSPFIALAVLGAADDVVRRRLDHRRARRRVRTAVTAALLVAAVVSAVQSLDVVTTFASRPFAITGARTETLAASVAHDLRRAGITRLYAQYWVAYDLDFIGAGAVTASPPDAIRSTAIAATVAAAPRPAWLFTGPSRSDAARTTVAFPDASNPYDLTATAFTRLLGRAGVSTRTVVVGTMVAVVPSARVTPADLHAFAAADGHPLTVGRGTGEPPTWRPRYQVAWAVGGRL
jgi:GNAT superfamily N-acetyltransferase